MSRAQSSDQTVTDAALEVCGLKRTHKQKETSEKLEKHQQLQQISHIAELFSRE